MRLKYTNINKLGFALVIMVRKDDLADRCARDIRRIVRHEAPVHTSKNLPQDGNELVSTRLDKLQKNRETAYDEESHLVPESSCIYAPKNAEKDLRKAMRTPWHEYVRRAYQWFKR